MEDHLHLDVQQIAASQENGYDMYRVPGLIITESGVLLLYCDGRRKVLDQPVQSLLMFRSEDNGRCFSETRTMVEGQINEQVHNPMMIAGHDAEVHFFWNISYSRFFYRRSIDAGLTWGETVELTDILAGFRPEYPWNSGAYASGHGIMMRNGRLVAPIWLSTGGSAHRPAHFGCLFSNDNGCSWQRGELLQDNETAGVCNLTEGSIAELDNNQIIATLRHGEYRIRKRAFVLGAGGMTWGQPFFNKNLADPICAGSLCRFDNADPILIFSNCAWEDPAGLEAMKQDKSIRWSKEARQNITIRVSRDEGLTWSDGALLEKYGGYSDLAVSHDKRMIFCFYESGWMDGNCFLNKRLLLARFNLAWIEK